VEKEILYLRRIQYLVDRMKNEKISDYRKISYLAVKAIILDLNERNVGNVFLHEKSWELVTNLGWLAHIDDPGHEDDIYIEEIDNCLNELLRNGNNLFNINTKKDSTNTLAQGM
jgi:hypothetical protein